MKIKIFLFSLFVFFGTYNFAIAQSTAIPSLVPLSTASETKAYDTGNYTLNDLLITGVNVTKIILGVVGSLALMMFIYGGVMMLISSGSSEKVTQAKGIIMAAVIGLAIIFASYIIIRFVITAIGGDPVMTGVWGDSKIDVIK